MGICKFTSFALIFIAGLMGAQVLNAMEVTVKLTDVRAERTLEKEGDEIYFNITQYSNQHKPQDLRIPVYPSHWLSKQLSKVKNVILWQGTVEKGESIRLILSLLEQDSPPWDLDTMIGSTELTLENRQGKLIKTWGIPAFEKRQEAEMLKPSDPQRYVFKGAGSRYDVAFLVEQKK